jgi:hypothetical protein
MVECMSYEQMQFFTSLLGNIVSTAGAEKNYVVINAEVGPVYWELLGDIYCMVKKVTL